MKILPCISLRTSLLKMIITLTISQTIQLSSSINSKFQNCSILYNCGSLRSIGYPFYGGDRPSYCGTSVFNLDCLNDRKTSIWIDHMSHFVLGINESVHKMTIARRDLFTNTSCPYYNVKNTTLSMFGPWRRDLRILNIFYGCTSEVIRAVQIKSNVTCSVGGDGDGVFFAHEFISGINGCKFSIVVPMLLNAYNDLWDQKITLGTALKQGFDVEYSGALVSCSTCEASGGKCGSDDGGDFVCFCPHGSYPFVCPNIGNGRLLKIIIGVGISGIGILAFIYIYYTYLKHSSVSIPFQLPWNTNENQELDALINKFGSSTPRRYSYADIKKMTNSFKDELGKGGFGIVYKGFLSNGLPVAVKLLNATKGNGEEFVNEVASISRTSHINVVSLLGFCFEGHHRAVLYEFMPNGSLEKYIRKESDSQMGFKGLFEIAIGVARGLEYLHGGCNTRILHFDIKPHNILLDEDFCPKISDFGLAKLCNRNESIVSMLEARGTIGYIAPEVFYRGYGFVSYKSDVYSYGMMVLEIVGARNKPINAEISNSSETYFPDWAYQRVTRNDEDQNLQADDEDELERKMISVGLWCIQTNPSHRPSMNKVIEMLEGSLEGLEIPPKPMLHFTNLADGSFRERSDVVTGTVLSSSIRSQVSYGLELKVITL